MGRLAEDPSLVIGVIEAGTSHAEDPLVDVPCERFELHARPLVGRH